MPSVTAPIASSPKQNYVVDAFTYDLDFTAGIAAASTSNGSFTIQADSDFKWLKSTFFADVAGAAQTASGLVIPLCTILITDQGSGRQLMNVAVPVTNIFGTGQIPFILPVPRIFTSKSTVGVSVSNFSAATTYNLRLSFIGAKIFKL